MTATTIEPTRTRALRPIWRFARRLGDQAIMSVIVMAGLQFASVNGYDVRDLLPARPADPAASAPEPARVAGVPAAFDRPMQAGSVPDQPAPGPAAAKPDLAAVEAPQPTGPKDEVLRLSVALPSIDHVAVPTPRPRVETLRPAAVPPRPSEVPFDVTPPDVEVYGMAELGRDEAPPIPVDLVDAGFHFGDLMPPAPAILTRTAEVVTSSAAHAVTGTATRFLELVR